MRLKICHQPKSLGEMSPTFRWFIFVNCLIEAAMWTGNIFGWASLVHVLKTKGVYSGLCHSIQRSDGLFNRTNASTVVVAGFGNVSSTDLAGGDGDGSTFGTSHVRVSLGCIAQDEQFALVCTVAMVLYSIPGILVGYALHHIGLAFTRLMGGLMLTVGFLMLSFTSKETSNYIWGASILLSVGGNTIRMAGLEFGNLFPKRRATIMAAISSMYTISAALFMLMQSVSEAGYSWESICLSLAAATTLIVAFTPLIPRHHIPYGGACAESPSEKEEKKVDPEKRILSDSFGHPLRQSLTTLSAFLHLFWIFSALFAITIYGTYFNSWINRFVKSDDEAAYYSRLYGYANLLCIFIIPLPGLLIDTLSSRLQKGKEGLEAKVASVQASILPMVFVTTSVTVQLCCFFFFSPGAVYFSLLCLVINRPSCLGVGIPYIRSRFPADHFNRLIGIQGTIVSLLTMLQYPHFTWTQSDYFMAMGLLVAFVTLSLLNPLHLLNKTYLRRSLSSYILS